MKLDSIGCHISYIFRGAGAHSCIDEITMLLLVHGLWILTVTVCLHRASCPDDADMAAATRGESCYEEGASGD